MAEIIFNGTYYAGSFSTSITITEFSLPLDKSYYVYIRSASSSSFYYATLYDAITLKSWVSQFPPGIYGERVFIYLTDVQNGYNAPLAVRCADALSSGVTYPFLLPTTPLATPTGLNADNITSNSARVSWTAVENASGYKVEYRRQGDTTWNE